MSLVPKMKKWKDDEIRYFLRSLNSAENKYYATESECSAIVSDFKIFGLYLQMKHFTDHKRHAALLCTIKINEPSVIMR